MVGVVDFRQVDWHAEAERACTRKRVYGWDTARRVAASKRARGEQVRAYRCPWCSRFHVGHVPSQESLVRLAAALRARANDNGPDAA